MGGSSLLGACRAETQSSRRSVHHLKSHCVTSLHPSFPPSSWASFFALMWPEVEQLGSQSGIPPHKYLHTESGGAEEQGSRGLALAKKRESPRGTQSLAQPYTDMTKEQRSGEERSGGVEGWRRDEEGGVEKRSGEWRQGGVEEVG